MQYNINREEAKILALLSGRIDKYEYLAGEEILPSNQRQIIEQDMFSYSSLGKAFQKQTKKQVGVIEPLDFCNKKNELKQIQGIFPQNLMNNLIYANLKEIVKFQDVIRKDDLNHKSKGRKTYNFSKYSLLIVFSKDIHEWYLSLENADLQQSNFAVELKNFEKGTKKKKKSLFK